MLAERMEFFLKFVNQPDKIGSITPSSGYLTKKMFEGVAWQDIQTIVELGAGTGVFTNYIAQNKKRTCQALIFEQNLDMRKEIEKLYPDFYYADKAQSLAVKLEEFSLPKADCIISGLPFSIFPRELTDEIFQAVADSLQTDGVFVAFQYSPYLSGLLKSYFSQVETSFVLLNMPPAFVFKCKK